MKDHGRPAVAVVNRAERAEALRQRFELEVQELGNAAFEVVVLGVASEEALRRTQAMSFQSAADWPPRPELARRRQLRRLLGL